MSVFIKPEPADSEELGNGQKSKGNKHESHQSFNLSECDAILDAVDVECWQMTPSRVPYTADQIQTLEKRFEKNQFCQKDDRIAVANAVNLTPKQVKIWFQNRRAKAKQVSSGWKERTQPSDSQVNKVQAKSVEPKPIRHRTVFTNTQQNSLEELFKAKKYLSFAERCEIASSLKLNPLQVQVWFQNRRARLVKSNKTLTNFEANVKTEDELADVPEQIVSLISPDCYPLD
uniref:Double homeobox protein 4 n=1 Tax=Culex pipiens TaxID=7175 RepID=A0A8D8HWL1_CULPI